MVELKSAQAVEKVELQLLDAYGKLLRKQKVEQVEVGINKISMETADLPTGTYFIKILGIDQLQSPLKFIRSNF
ncbi:MAG: T9SS type A sorting domain-containing protein [Saprospiraceae bacterium]|nr:T9SS type A sorting domain-containing protein [Saprospiraceae bacterium]